MIGCLSPPEVIVSADHKRVLMRFVQCLYGMRTSPSHAIRFRLDPGCGSYAATGVGRLTHLTGELLQRETGIKLLLVPYTGGPSHAVTDVATGRVSMIIEGYSGVAGAARSGSIKLIAVASAKRLAEFPDVPTVAETIPGFQATGWGFSGARRHARSNHRQDQRRPAESYARSGTAKETRTTRQLHKSDVSRRSHGVRSQPAVDVAIGPRRNSGKRAMMAAYLRMGCFYSGRAARLR
jgi:hypothetical protein